MKKEIVLSLLIVAPSLFAQTIQWRGTDRSGVYRETGLMKSWPAEGPTMLWHYDGLGAGHSSASIDGDKIYLTGMVDKTGYLYVFDLKGKLLNKKAYGGEWHESYNGSRGTVTVSDGKAYLVSGMGVLYCMDAKTLDVVWTKDLLKDFSAENITWGINEAPLIIGDKVIATPGGKEHNVVALNKATGALIWSCAGEGDKSAYCSPLYLPDQTTPLIVTMTADHIIGIEAATGKKLWSHENKNRHAVHANTPVYGDNMLLCTSGYKRGSTMLRLSDGGRKVEEAWFSADMDNRIGAMVKVGDYAYGSGDGNRFWFCADWKTGEIKWKKSELAMGAIIANDGMLYCYADNGDLMLVKATPEKFDLVSKFAVTKGTEQHWAHPVIYKGVLYVRHGDSLMAYKLS